MTSPTHDSFVEMVGAYALGALDAADRRAFEAHLATCATCQRELADLRRVTAGLGMSVDPVAPPASLKARTLANATSQPQARATPQMPASATPGPVRTPRMSFEWLLAAASLAAAIGAGIYAWSLRSQMEQMRQTVTELSTRANDLRDELDRTRRESARLAHVIEIVQAPATIQVNLSGTKDAPGALGRAFYNGTRGMVVSTERLPALRPGRAYQLWMIVPSVKDPLSAGVFSVTPDGAGTFVATMPANFTVPAGSPVTLAITEEPAGGSPGPTTNILLAGQMRGQ